VKRELHILMLEDNDADAELVEHTLRRGGLVYSGERAETRAGFLRALERSAPDLILSDSETVRVGRSETGDSKHCETIAGAADDIRNSILGGTGNEHGNCGGSQCHRAQAASSGDYNSV
jgi:hypothetical protein